MMKTLIAMVSLAIIMMIVVTKVLSLVLAPSLLTFEIIVLELLKKCD